MNFRFNLMKKISCYFFITLIFMFVFLFLTELILRSNKEKYSNIAYYRGWVKYLYSDLSYFNEPNYIFISENELGEKIEIKVNKYGLRSVLENYGNYKNRILILGDSFVFAENTEYSKSFVEKINDHLKLKNNYSQDSIIAINAGVNGYSNHEELILLKRLYPQIRPNMVLLSVYLGNDLRDAYFITDKQKAYIESKAFLYSEDKKDTNTESEFILLYDKIKNKIKKILKDNTTNIILLRISYNAFSGFKYKNDLTMADYFYSEIEFYKNKISNNAKLAIDNLDITMKNFSAFCKLQNINCMVVLIPSKAQVYEDINYLNSINFDNHEKVNALLKLYREKEFSFDNPSKIYEAILQKNKLPYLNTMKLLRNKRNEQLFYKIDRHWSNFAQEIVAKEVVRYFDLASIRNDCVKSSTLHKKKKNMK